MKSFSPDFFDSFYNILLAEPYLLESRSLLFYFSSYSSNSCEDRDLSCLNPGVLSKSDYCFLLLWVRYVFWVFFLFGDFLSCSDLLSKLSVFSFSEFLTGLWTSSWSFVVDVYSVPFLFLSSRELLSKPLLASRSFLSSDCLCLSCKALFIYSCY